MINSQLDCGEGIYDLDEVIDQVNQQKDEETISLVFKPSFERYTHLIERTEAKLSTQPTGPNLSY